MARPRLPPRIREAQNICWADECVLEARKREVELRVPSLHHAEKLSLALRAYDNAVELDPLNRDAYWSKAMLLEREGRKEDELAELKKMLKLFPDDEEAIAAARRLREGKETRRPGLFSESYGLQKEYSLEF